MITLVSTPACADTVDPTVVYRWLATESPNNFRLFRNDWVVLTTANNAGYLEITLDIDGAFPGTTGDAIAVYNFTNEAMHTGLITNVAGAVITTDIVFVTDMDIRYMNDNTLYPNYYFEGRLTINGAVEALTVIASPDSFGYADLDVSGILRIHTALGKTGNYSSLIMKETTKSGSFIFEYRGVWYKGTSWGAEEGWVEADDDLPIVSPPFGNTWYYGECVRSEEQGSNLHEYVPSEVQDAPFLNSFAEPVYFRGMPFDLSFIIPEISAVVPESHFVVTQKIYNSMNTQLGGDIVTAVDADALEGFINSLNINETTIPMGAYKMTFEIELI
ncbi:MAG TPA: hypothetical protein VMV77_08805 [Bacteroidales bacterium]|nr:hypothetical protein [Bacteroidales bacterium]